MLPGDVVTVGAGKVSVTPLSSVALAQGVHWSRSREHETSTLDIYFAGGESTRLAFSTRREAEKVLVDLLRAKEALNRAVRERDGATLAMLDPFLSLRGRRWWMPTPRRSAARRGANGCASAGFSPRRRRAV